MTIAEWVLLVSGLLAVAVALSVTAGRYRLPISAILALVGFAAGAVGAPFGLSSPLDDAAFNEVVLSLFLPVLVFEAAISLSTRAFVRNVAAIMLLAIPAVAVSAVLVGLVLHFGLAVALVPALLFGALISATDPVAVSAVFREVHAPRRLLALVEGESLFNDAVAIVLVDILLAAALGAAVHPATGTFGFAAAFVGGIFLGMVVGLLAAAFLPWLRPLPSAALSIAVAYGSFALADHVLGFSGVLATVTAGLVLGALAPSRAAAPTRALWRELWSALGFVANGLLFLLIGLALDPGLLVAHAGAITVAILAVLVARPLAIVPLLAVLERVAGLPHLDVRNLAVLVWGGLRGGVALALALALPADLPERSLFVALTGGVVLATLVVNATTVRVVVQRTGIARPTRTDRFLAASAHHTGIHAARERLRELGLADAATMEALDEAEARVVEELGRVPLSPEEEVKVVTARGLHVERDTYQHLSDARLIPAPVARSLLDEVDDEVEGLSLEQPALVTRRERRPPLLDRFFKVFVARLPGHYVKDPTDFAYAEASARRLAARRTADALALFAHLPNVREEPVREARRTFSRWEEEAIATLRELDERHGRDRVEVRRRQVEALSRLAAEEALQTLVAVGLIPAGVAARASRVVETEVEQGPAP